MVVRIEEPYWSPTDQFYAFREMVPQRVVLKEGKRMKNDRRNTNGTFAKGNAGGPGRPRRAVEVEYLAKLGETVSLADWQKVVAKAKKDAIAGDARARDWLSRFLLGTQPTQSLLDIAAGEAAEISTEEQIDLRSKQIKEAEMMANMNSMF